MLTDMRDFLTKAYQKLLERGLDITNQMIPKWLSTVIYYRFCLKTLLITAGSACDCV